MDVGDIPSILVGDSVGKIVISDVDIDVPLLYGSMDECLHTGAGVRVQRNKPGCGKPVMIAGHTIPYFKNLGMIEPGQIITMETYYGIFTYEITAVLSVFMILVSILPVLYSYKKIEHSASTVALVEESKNYG